ncbi:MAG: peptide-methionine (S)-S-oxide reductase [Natronomonas sp.]|jgi:peptide-methionine (S)-S-oxide reductase
MTGSSDTAAQYALDTAAPPPSETRTATFGMGCFWGPEARFGIRSGVVRTRVGYAGGTTTEPSYYSLGDHTEVVQVSYDPDETSYESLLEVFWAHHDPFSTPKRQYRGVALVADERQRAAAERTRERLAARAGREVATRVESLNGFTLAEAYHQKHHLRSAPVGDRLLSVGGLDVVDSTVAARLNGFIAGHGDDDRRAALLGELDLPPAVLTGLEARL